MRCLTSSERGLPMFQGVFPLFAADILALDAVVWVYPPASVGIGISGSEVVVSVAVAVALTSTLAVTLAAAVTGGGSCVFNSSDGSCCSVMKKEL